MDINLLKFGFDAFMGLGSGWLQKQQVKAQNKIRSAEVYASNLMRSANNELASKRDSLARYTQSVGNQRVMEDAGNVVNANVTNYLRGRDDLDNADLESQIAFMEQAGAQAAASAASGLTGGVIDTIAGTMALRESRRAAQTDRVRGQVKVDFAQAQRQNFLAALSRTDNSDIVTNIDYSMDTFTPAVRSGNLFTDVFGGQSKDSMSAALGAASKAGKSLFSFNTPSVESYYGVR